MSTIQTEHTSVERAAAVLEKLANKIEFYRHELAHQRYHNPHNVRQEFNSYINQAMDEFIDDTSDIVCEFVEM